MSKSKRYTYNCPAYDTMRDLVLQSAALYGEKIVFSWRENPLRSEKTSVSFLQFESDVKALGTEMINRGMKGRHIALVGKLSYGWILTYFASLSIGSVLVTIDPEWTAEDLAQTINRADVSFLICDHAIEGKMQTITENNQIESIVYTEKGEDENVFRFIEAGHEKVMQGDCSFMEAEIDPKALALLVFTSGTTGQGKGVMLSQSCILKDVSSGMSVGTLGPKQIGFLPPYHTFGSTCGLLAPVSLGSELYLSAGLKYVAKELAAETPDTLLLVPLFLETFAHKIKSAIKEKGKEKLVATMMKVSNGLRKIGIDLTDKLFASILTVFGGKLKVIVTGGAPLSPDVQYLFSSLGITVMNGYGITECSPLVSVNPNHYIVPGTVGQIIPCNTVKIENPNENGEGEICIKGDNVMMGYYKNEEATKEAIDEDGYFHTGDIGKIHEKSGFLMITGRIKNIIILSNGKNVYPEEIELELSSIPGVHEVIVYEGQSRLGVDHNRIVAEFYIPEEYLTANGITDAHAYLVPLVEQFNKTTVPYKKIGLIRVRPEPFVKNTLRKIVRFKIDKTID